MTHREPHQARSLKVKLRRARGRTQSSKQWLERQLNDPYVAAAKREGYRSRAAYKLEEIADKYEFLKPGGVVIDLGAAPGGWSQVAARRVNAEEGRGAVVALDLLPFDPIAGVVVLEQDFTAAEAESRLFEALGGRKADAVLSDMAAPTTGHRQTDHLRILGLFLFFLSSSLLPFLLFPSSSPFSSFLPSSLLLLFFFSFFFSSSLLLSSSPFSFFLFLFFFPFSFSFLSPSFSSFLSFFLLFPFLLLLSLLPLFFSSSFSSFLPSSSSFPFFLLLFLLLFPSFFFFFFSFSFPFLSFLFLFLFFLLLPFSSFFFSLFFSLPFSSFFFFYLFFISISFLILLL
jgi:cell division protein FtsJ